MLLGGIRLGRSLLQVLENLLNDFRIFDAGNDLNLTAAVFADFDIDVENSRAVRTRIHKSRIKA